MNNKWITSLLIILLPTTVFAYIDPGTGGLIIGSWSWIIAVIGVISGFILLRIIKPIKNILKNK